MSEGLDRLMEMAREEVDGVLASLPEPLVEAAEYAPVTFSDRPDAELISTGIEPDVLGLFLGSTWSEMATGAPIAPGIFLFVENLWQASGHHLCTFREEVRTTYLHELGHFLGLDEEEVAKRGLE